MQYQELFKKSYRLIRNTREEFQSIINNEDNSQKAMNDFVLPMTGLCALSAFLGVLFEGLDFERALIISIISLGKSLGGIYLSFMVFQETARFFELKKNKVRFMQLASYSYVVIFSIDIITNLIPELFFLNIVKLFMFYLMWEAVDVCTNISEDKRMQYAIITSIIVLLSSFIIEKILYIFLPGAEIIAA